MTDKNIEYEPLPVYEDTTDLPRYTEVPEESEPSTMARRSRSQHLLRLILLALVSTLIMKGLYSSFRHGMRSIPSQAPIHPPHEPLQWLALNSTPSTTTHTPVALEAHIMSKCPDAKACLQLLLLPVMSQLHSHINFTLSFLGSVDPHSDAVSCMHGPGECLGDMILLCAAKLYPDPKIHLGYANCLIDQYPSIPERELVEGCALEHGIDFAEVNRCISDDGGEGVGLLRESILRSKEENVTKSCTVRVNGEVRCIRDGGKWYDCPGGSGVDDLVRDIEDAYYNGSASGR